MSKKLRFRSRSSQLIILGYTSLILLGTFLLMLPISTKARVVTPFLDSFFTATSASCVTGLIVRDTGSYWSAFGQAVILCLIQIGGLGIVTVAIMLSLVTGRKIGLSQRGIMKDSISAPQVGGIVKLTKFIIKSVAIFEIAGFLLLLPVFVRDFGIRGIWYSLFHTISAFCNAGFDLMGSQRQPFSSFWTYGNDPWLNIVIMLLIIIGGIGFLVWKDIQTNKFHFRHYSQQTRTVLTVTTILILLPALYYFFFEFRVLPLGERTLKSFFASVTTRTAGFETSAFADMSDGGKTISIILQLIGGSPGSTAGGMKTTTAAVLMASMISVFRRKQYTKLGKRRISNEVIKTASAIFFLYVLLFVAGAIIISRYEGLPITDCMFETASAIGTVGLSLGITSSLGSLSRLILIMLMFFGRVGGLTLIYAAVSNKNSALKLPEERITVG